MRSILIAEEQITTFSMPWKLDSTCFNFNLPKELVLPENIADIEDKNDIGTLVVACELPDHSFISELKKLRQLYIYTGGSVSDLSFIEGLVELRQLCLYDTHIESLDPLIRLAEEKSRLHKETEDVWQRISLTFEGVCITSDKLDYDPNDLRNDDTLYATDIIINKKRANRRF